MKIYDKDAIALAERLLGKKQGELDHLRKFDTREKLEAELARLVRERESKKLHSKAALLPCEGLRRV